MKVILIGAGRMGRMLAECAPELGIEVAGQFDEHTIGALADAPRVDAVIDFSAPAALAPLAAYVRRTGTALVSGTTGYSQKELEGLHGLAEAAPVVASANYSVGVAVLKHLAAEASKYLRDFDVEVVETHHRMKKDAPSGTAKMLLAAIDPAGERRVVSGREGLCPRTTGEIGVHAVRGGTVAGVHTVSFFGDEEEVSLTHRAESRRIFALGALKAARLLAGRPASLYTLDDLIFSRSA